MQYIVLTKTQIVQTHIDIIKITGVQMTIKHNVSKKSVYKRSALSWAGQYKHKIYIRINCLIYYTWRSCDELHRLYSHFSASISLTYTNLALPFVWALFWPDAWNNLTGSSQSNEPSSTDWDGHFLSRKKGRSCFTLKIIPVWSWDHQIGYSSLFIFTFLSTCCILSLIQLHCG